MTTTKEINAVFLDGLNGTGKITVTETGKNDAGKVINSQKKIVEPTTDQVNQLKSLIQTFI